MEKLSGTDLRNVYEPKNVAIEKRGKAFAILPSSRQCDAKPVTLPDYEGRLKRIFRGRVPRGATATELVDYLRREY